MITIDDNWTEEIAEHPTEYVSKFTNPAGTCVVFVFADMTHYVVRGFYGDDCDTIIECCDEYGTVCRSEYINGFSKAVKRAAYLVKVN